MTFSVLSLPLQNMCLFGHVTKCLKRVFFQRAFQTGIRHPVFCWAYNRREGWIEGSGICYRTSRNIGANYFSPTPRYHERGTSLILTGRAWNFGLLEGGSGWAVNLGNGEAETDGSWLRCSIPVFKAGIFSEREGLG